MSKKITQKIRDLLTPEDLKIFEGAMEDMINNRVSKKVNDQVTLREEELKKEYATLSEEFCNKEVTKRLEDEKANLIETYDSKLVNLETKIVSRLDSFLESTINEQISDDMLEKVAINETLLPLVNGLKEAFAKYHVELDSTGEKAIKELAEEKEKNAVELTEAIAKNMEYEERLEKAGVFLLISQKSKGLTETETAHVVKTFKDRKFEEVDGKIDDFITVLKEGVKKETKKNKSAKTSKKKKVDDVITENEGLEAPKKKVVKDEEINESGKKSMSEIANAYIF